MKFAATMMNMMMPMCMCNMSIEFAARRNMLMLHMHMNMMMPMCMCNMSMFRRAANSMRHSA